MDILLLTALEIQRIVSALDLKCEIEPTIADMKDTKLVLKCRTFWDEPVGYIHEPDRSSLGIEGSAESSLEEDGGGYSTYRINLPVELSLVSQNSGEYWRQNIINITKELTKIFLDIKHLGIVGGKYTDEAVERIQAKIPDFENKNAYNGLSGYIEFIRDPDSDVCFEKEVEFIDGVERNGGYAVKCVWIGNIILYDGE
jgi:hypothetical protein